MIYDPICRQAVTIIGRFPVQQHSFKFGKKVEGEARFVKVRYGEPLPNFKVAIAVGETRECDINYLVADDGILEINRAYELAPELAAA